MQVLADSLKEAIKHNKRSNELKVKKLEKEKNMRTSL